MFTWVNNGKSKSYGMKYYDIGETTGGVFNYHYSLDQTKAPAERTARADIKPNKHESMNDLTKKQITDHLGAYVKRYDSQNAAANSLTGISSATISQILNGNTSQVSEAMWRKIAKQTGYTLNPWIVANTSVYNKLSAYFGDAQRNPKGIHAIVINAGMGKSVAVKSYTALNPSAYYICCHRHMPIRILLRDMLKSMGKDSSGTIAEMLDNLVSYLERDNDPLFIIDEVDKLRDEVLEMFVDLENKLHGKCGLVFIATPYLKKRIEAGVNRNKRGFTELYSRMKRICWEFTPSRGEFRKDVALICKANGVNDEQAITEMHNKCENDLRVLTDLINSFKAA
jgi:DNA transposition AAA+ family ATPase